MIRNYHSCHFSVIGLFAALALLGSCRPVTLYAVDPPGPPEYAIGWEDGCDTGMSAQGGWDYKIMYGFKKRMELADHEAYKTGWNEGFGYCRFTLANVQASTQWDAIGLGDGF